MPVDKLTIEQFAQKVKAKYPEYKDVNDSVLVDKMVNKYPEYKERINYSVSQQPQPAQNAFKPMTDWLAVPQEAQPMVPENAVNDHNTKVAQSKERVNAHLGDIDNSVHNLIHEHKQDLQGRIVSEQLGLNPKEVGPINPQAQQLESQLRQGITVAPKEVSDFKTGMATDPAMARMALNQKAKDLAKKDPNAAKQLKGDLYRIDRQNDPSKDSKISENIDKINSGEYDYDITHGQLVKPQGFLGSLVTGYKEKVDAFDDYDVYKTGDKDAILKRINERTKYDPDKAIPVSEEGWLSHPLGEMGKAFGGLPLKPLIAGAIAGRLGPQAGAAAAAAVSVPEMYKLTFGSALPHNYDALKKQNPTLSEDEVLQKAIDLTDNQANTDAAIAAAMGGLGAKAGFAPTGLKNTLLQKSLRSALGQIGQEGIKKTIEGLGVGALGAGGQYIKNVMAQKAGIPTDTTEGMAQQLWSGVGMTMMMTIAAKTPELLKPKTYNQFFQAVKDVPTETIQHHLDNLKEAGQITEEQAQTFNKSLEEHKALDNSIKTHVPESDRLKVQELIKERDQLKAGLETEDEAYRSETNEKIKALNERINNVSKGQDRGELQQFVDEAFKNEDIKRSTTDDFRNASENDLKKHFKEIARLAHDPNTEAGMRDTFGDDIVNKAKELYPQEPPKESKISVIQPGEIKQPETITIAPKEEIKPVSENIQPNKEFQTMNMGKDEGQPETKEAREQMKARMVQGDVPIDGEGGKGETGRGFAGRVLSAWENLKKSGDHNTSLITHSSVLKAIKTWENAKTWEGIEKPTDPTQMNSEQWKRFADEFNKERTENGDLETFKGDKGDIHVIRHGQTEDNKLNKFRSGNTNLTEEGIQQAHEVGKKLQEKTGGNVPKIITSDLPRAVHTSNIIHENLKPTENAETIRSNQGEVLGTGDVTGQRPDARSENIQQPASEEPVNGETQQQAGIGSAKEEGNAPGEKEVETPAQKQVAALSVDEAYGLPFIEEPSDKRTGIKNIISKATRFERRLPPVEVGKLGTDQEILLEGKSLVDNNVINPLDVVNRILDTKEGMQPDEAKAMQYYMHQLAQQDTNLRESLAGAANEADRAEINGQLQQLSDEIDAATQANIISGKAWSDVGNIRQIVSDTGFNASRDLATIKEAYQGKIPKDVQAKLDRALKERDEALNKLAKLQAEEKNKAAEDTIKKESAPKSTKKTKEEFKNERTEIKKSISDKLKKGRTGESGLTAVPLPFAKELISISPEIFKLIKSYAEEGVQKTEEVINRLHDVLKDELEGINKADIVNLLAGRYKAEGENVSKISQRIRDFRTEANLWTKIADATKMEEDTPVKKQEKNKKLQDLRDRLNEIRTRNKEAIVAANDVLTTDVQKELNKLQRQRRVLETRYKNKKYLVPPEEKKTPFSEEILKEKQRIINANYKIRVEKRKAFESQKNFYQKSLMWIGRGVRLSVLSGYNVLGKLASAATLGGAAKRIPDQAIGFIYGNAFKGISEKAPIEGFVSAGAEAKFYKEFFNPKTFVKNAWQILKSGESPLSKKFSPGTYEHIPGIYLATDLHQIIKDPLKRATYEASLKNAFAWAERNGMNINDDLVVQSLETAAYKRAQYEIFQEQNWLSKKFGEWKHNMEEAGNLGATGKFLADFMIPVSTVPTNIARRMAITSPLGLIKGAAGVVEAYRKGIESLTPEQADSVMRQLKQGTLGTALWLIGWYGYSQFGGLYSKFNPNKQRDQGDLTSDEMSVGGKMIPKPIQHALPLEIIQFAATARRVYDNYREHKDASVPEAIEKAGLASIGALTEQIPVVETVAHTIGAFNNPYEAKKLEEDVQRRFEPQILRETGVIGKEKGGSSGGAGATSSYSAPKTSRVTKIKRISHKHN